MTAPRFISSSDIKNNVTVGDLIGPLSEAMIAVAQRRAVHPRRIATDLAGPGKLGVMFGGIATPYVHGAKILSLYPDAPKMGLSSHQGVVVLFDSTDGRPLSILDADTLTAMRTAGISVLATKTLARPNPSTITVCGAGEQASWHVDTFLQTMPEANIRIWARDPVKAETLASCFGQFDDRISVFSDLAEAVSGADVVNTVTASKTAFLPGRLLEPGQHVNLVGASLASAREIDDHGVARLTMFTDAISSSEIESGEIIEARQNGAIDESYKVTELGAVLSGDAPGRESDNQITGYKSHGLIVQDLAAASLVESVLAKSATT